MFLFAPIKILYFTKKYGATIIRSMLFGILSFPSQSMADKLELPPALGSVANVTTPASTPEYVVITPSQQVTYSSETAASIDKLNVKEGNFFKKGDILLTLDCRIQESELQKAQAEANAATQADNSAIKLKSYGSISQLEFIKAQSDAQIAQAEVQKLKAVVDKCVITAPFNGAVAEMMVHPLESVKPGDPLIKIIGTENLEFKIEVPSSWLSWLKVGSDFFVQLNELNKKIDVKIVRIDPEIDSVSQTIKITGQISTEDPTLLPGMSGQAIFPENPDNKKVVKNTGN